MIVAAGSLAVGILIGLATLRSVDSGETWDDWRHVRTPWWWTPFSALLVVATMVGVDAYGLPGEFRAVLVGLPVGVCVTAFTIGIRRWRAREKKPSPSPSGGRSGGASPSRSRGRCRSASPWG